MHFYFLWVGGEQSTCFFMCTRRGVATSSPFSTCGDSHILKGNWDDVGPISFWNFSWPAMRTEPTGSVARIGQSYFHISFF
jgi:hypothetical protein